MSKSTLFRSKMKALENFQMWESNTAFRKKLKADENYFQEKLSIDRKQQDLLSEFEAEMLNIGREREKTNNSLYNTQKKKQTQSFTKIKSKNCTNKKGNSKKFIPSFVVVYRNEASNKSICTNKNYIPNNTRVANIGASKNSLGNNTNNIATDKVASKSFVDSNKNWVVDDTTVLKCDLCSLTWPSPQSLKVHQTRSHKNHNFHGCDECDHSCSNLQLLKAHKKSAHRQEPFQCRLCNYGCLTMPFLKRHMRRKHNPASKTYLCAECDYSTIEKHNMKRHVIIHSGAKPFDCEACKFSTADTSTLKRHVKTKHAT